MYGAYLLRHLLQNMNNYDTILVSRVYPLKTIKPCLRYVSSTAMKETVNVTYSSLMGL